MNPLALMAASYAASAASTAISNKMNSSTQKDLIDYNQAYYDKNLEKNYDINRDMVRSQKTDEVQSLKMAGLSPLLANGSFSGISNVQAPMGGHTAPDSKIDLLQANSIASNINLQEAQAELAHAEASKATAEAEKTSISNEEEVDYNATWTENFKALANRLKDDKLLAPHVRDMFKSIADNEDFATTRGGSRAVMEFLAFSPTIFKSIADELKERQQINVVFDQIHDKKVHDALVSMPVVQKAQYVANAVQLYSLANKLNEDANLDRQQVEEIGVRMNKLIAETRSIHHDDNLAMLEDGEYGNVMLSVGGEAAREGAHILGNVITAKVGAATYGAAAAKRGADVVVNNVNKSSKSSSAPSPDSAPKPLSKEQINESTKHLPKHIREKVRAEEYKKSNLSRYLPSKPSFRSYGFPKP